MGMTDDPGPPVDVKNLWIIRGKRYDLSRDGFLDRHPGGRMALEYARGRDCTELFESYHSLSDKPMAMMKKFEDEDQTSIPPAVFQWTKTPFYDRLKMQVRDYFGGTEGVEQRRHKCDAAAWARYLLWCVLTVVSFSAWRRGEWWSLVTLPVFYWLGPSGLMHSGSHWALSGSPIINCLGAYAGSAHVSVMHWYHQHVIGHHSHTNLEGLDPDMNHFQHLDEAGPGYRLHRNQPVLEKYRAWRSAAVMQAWFTTMGPSLVNQALYVVTEKVLTVPVLNVSLLRILWHLAGRLAVFYVITIYPWTVFEPGKAMFFCIVPYGIHGCIYWAVSQVSHLNDECVTDTPELKDKEWAVHQVESCNDYCTDSVVWRTLSIGLNAQAIHHLFPHVEPCHYGPLSKILENTCKEFGVKYSTSPSFGSALVRHLQYIASLNDAPDPKVD